MKAGIKNKFKASARVSLSALIAGAVISALMIHSAGATHWPFGMLHNSGDTSLSKGYFTQREVTGIGPAVLPSYNYGGTECTGYTYSEWQADGSPSGTQKFSIPNSIVWSGNLDSGNNTRKQQLYDFLRQIYNEGSNSGNCLERQKYFGVSFMVNTMLGITSNQVNNNAAIGNTKWSNFYDRLMQPDIYLTNSINFARSENTFIARRDFLVGLSGSAARDVSVHNDLKAEPTILLRRGSATGTILYAIKRRCANPTGNFSGLPPPPPPAPITCGNLITLPAEPEAGRPFRVRVSFNVGSGPGPDPTYTIFMTLPAAGLNGANIGSGTAPRGGSGVEMATGVIIPNSGQYEGSYRVEATNADPATLICNFGITFESSGRPPVRVYSLPYTKIYGGDVHAGAGYESSTGSCASDQNSGFIGYNRIGTGPFIGTGAQLAAMITGEAFGASSGQVRYPSDAKTLTFANTTPSYNGYGGQPFGGGLLAAGNAICAIDYFGNMPSGTSGLGPSTAANRPPGDYYRGGDLTITTGNFGLAQVDNIRTYYVEGNATINGDITYAGGNYQSARHIPLFRLVVKGNIYISPNVNRLDGIFIAQPDGPGTGRIYTCYPGHVPTASDMNDICRNSGRLVINGAVLAERVKFTRSNGTRSQASVSERHNNVGSVGNPAEVIRFSPEVWLIGGFGEAGTFDSVIALPPVL